MTQSIRIALGIALVTLVAACVASHRPESSGDDSTAQAILDLVLAAQPSPQDLPDGSTYNYIWAEHMMAWMAAEHCGYLPRTEVVARLRGLLETASRFETHHGFFYDAYDPATGLRATDKVYFQGWWLWALILTQHAYPEVEDLAGNLLDAIDYDAANMVNPDHSALAADVFTDSGEMSFWFGTGGDIAGELRTALIAYSYLTGDPTPWLLDHEPSFIDVGGHRTLSVWHHFIFDPFYVHLAFPEVGYFERSWREVVAGAREHRRANGMEFFATRMEPLEAWDLDPDRWPNTEHRVAKPWITWIVEPDAPVMERAWSPGYGVTQVCDNWTFAWGMGELSGLHPQPIRGGSNPAVFDLAFQLDVLPPDVEVPHPLCLTAIRIWAIPDPDDPPTQPLILSLNGVPEVEIPPAECHEEIEIHFDAPPALQHFNTLRIETRGEGSYRLARRAETFRTVRWRDEDDGAWREVDAPAVEVVVEGQCGARENPFAFLARCAGVNGFHPWHLLRSDDRLRDTLVAWVGDYSQETRLARIIHSVSSDPISVTHHLEPDERDLRWQVLDWADGEVIPHQRRGESLVWEQRGHQTVTLRPLDVIGTREQ